MRCTKTNSRLFTVCRELKKMEYLWFPKVVPHFIYHGMVIIQNYSNIFLKLQIYTNSSSVKQIRFLYSVINYSIFIFQRTSNVFFSIHSIFNGIQAFAVPILRAKIVNFHCQCSSKSNEKISLALHLESLVAQFFVHSHPKILNSYKL